MHRMYDIKLTTKLLFLMYVGPCIIVIKKTHHTQGNTTITTHKGSQLLKLIETRYQVQPSDNETSHRTYTTKNHNFTLTLPLPSLQSETTNVVINIIVVSS